jgi:hypothetical protein
MLILDLIQHCECKEGHLVATIFIHFMGLLSGHLVEGCNLLKH